MGAFGITDSEYSAWLQADSHVRVILVEVDSHDGVSVVTHYLSNYPFATRPIDTPANQIYEDVIEETPAFETKLDELFTGRSVAGWGELIITNASGEFDDWIDHGWDGRPVKVLIGSPHWNRPDFRTILNGVVADITVPNRGVLSLKLRDKTELLNKPLQTTLIGGTTNNVGLPVPICLGECFNITPVLIDSATHTYQVHDGQIEAITQVRDNGVSVSFTPNLAAGTFTLSAQPAGAITADVKGAKPSGVYLTKPEQFVEYVAVTKGGMGISEVYNVEETTNLVLYSQDFTNTIWQKSAFQNFGSGSVTNDPTIKAPDGSTTADTLYESTGIGVRDVYQDVFCDSGQITYSLYLNVSGKKYFRLYVFSGTDSVFCDFNLIDGTVGQISRGSSVGFLMTNVSFDLCEAPNGFYRIWVSFINPIARVIGFHVRPLDDSLTTPYGGNVSHRVSIWGAQIEQKSRPTIYEPTTSSQIARSRSIGCVQQWGVRLNTIASGYYVKDRVNIIDALDAVTQTAGLWWAFDRYGHFLIGQIDSAKVARINISHDDVDEGSVEIIRREIPVAQVQLGYKKNWSVQDAASLAGSVTEANRTLFSTEHSIVTATNSVPAKHLMAPKPDVVSTLIVSNADAATEAARQATLKSVVRTIVRLTANVIPFDLNLGDGVKFTHPRFGFAAGELAVVVGIREDMLTGKVELDLWK